MNTKMKSEIKLSARRLKVRGVYEDKETGNRTSVSREKGTTQVDKSYPNNTNINITDKSKTNLIN